MGKTEICDMDCFRCKYRDCINDETLTQAEQDINWREQGQASG